MDDRGHSMIIFFWKRGSMPNKFYSGHLKFLWECWYSLHFLSCVAPRTDKRPCGMILCVPLSLCIYVIVGFYNPHWQKRQKLEHLESSEVTSSKWPFRKGWTRLCWVILSSWKTLISTLNSNKQYFLESVCQKNWNAHTLDVQVEWW